MVLPDMAALLPPGLSIAAFEVGYVCGDGAEHRVPLAEALAVGFEQGLPVRRFASQQGQRHLSGLLWSATTGGHVGFESWLERDHLLALDFDPAVTRGCTEARLPQLRCRRRTNSWQGQRLRDRLDGQATARNG